MMAPSLSDGQKPAKGTIGNGSAVTIGFMLLVAGGIGSFAWQSATSTAELRNLAIGVTGLSSDLRAMRDEVQGMKIRFVQLEQKIENLSHAREASSPK